MDQEGGGKCVISGDGARANTNNTKDRDEASDSHRQKVPRLTPTCIIHMSDEDPEQNLLSPRDYESWKTLLKAATIRNHLPILAIAKDLLPNHVPVVFYHRQCRSLFTLKHDLEVICNKRCIQFGYEADDHELHDEGEGVTLAQRVPRERSSKPGS